MPSLRDLQRRFAADLAGDVPPAHPGLAIYRGTVLANWRNALAATYPVVRALTGGAFFDAAADGFARAHPSRGGDLNSYGGEFGDFLAAYPHAQDLPYLPDVARLEWALDEAHRAADCTGTPGALLAALAAIPAEAVAAQRLALDPSCRLLHSRFPVLRVYEAHREDMDDPPAVDLAAGPDYLLVRREGGRAAAERIAPGEHAWLAALAAGDHLAGALDAALAADPAFDIGAALARHVASGTIDALR